MHDVRPAAVAGMFYPKARDRLAGDVRAFLAEVPAAAEIAPKALIVPHAGYIYSGSIAAFAFARLAPLRETVKRVVLLGPSHRVAVRGLAVPEARAFTTPLGEVPIDVDAVARARMFPQVVASDAAHAHEHALEVQLPFLQTMLNGFSLVPFAVGHATPAEVAEVLDALWGGPETLIVISSDLSHYHPYAVARRVDRDTTDAILALSPTLDHEQACGATPINGLLRCAKERGLAPALLDLRNSGDTAGDRARVVGYAAFAFSRIMDERLDLGASLLALARGAIAGELGIVTAPDVATRALSALGATFVTLRLAGDLRGCIGTVSAWRPLADDVRENAVSAAFRDPRFVPLSRREFAATSIEVSLLGAHEPIAAGGEDEALAALRPGVDGVIIEYGRLRATFLPQVWEQLPDPRGFMSALKRKAGLPERFWNDEIRLARYKVEKFAEDDVRALP